VHLKDIQLGEQFQDNEAISKHQILLNEILLKEEKKRKFLI